MTIGNKMLNNFIQEYRDHLQDIELMYDYDLTTLSEHDKYVIHQYDVSILDAFISNMNYLDKNIILIKKDILNLFKNIHAKIDNIIETYSIKAIDKYENLVKMFFYGGHYLDFHIRLNDDFESDLIVEDGNIYISTSKEKLLEIGDDKNI